MTKQKPAPQPAILQEVGKSTRLGLQLKENHKQLKKLLIKLEIYNIRS